jgi:hypothetical protein
MLRAATIATLAVAACLTFPQSPALASDGAATHAYLVAGYALARAGVADIPVAQASARRAIRHFAQQCPKVGTGSPQDEEAQHMSLEAAGALWSAAYGTALKPIRAFARAIEPLRWTSPRITRLAHEFASSLLTLATLPMPDLCKDVASWKASGYRTIPPSTLAFDRLVDSTEGHHPVPESLLSRYESPGDRALVRLIKPLERKVLDSETVLGFDDWDQLLEALELQQ